MAGTKVENLLLTSGQNSGIDLAVLPAGQMASVFNLRMRRGSQWGKRYGHTSLSTTGLGTGTGLIRSIGGGKGSANTCFVVVDDKCSAYDQTAAAFVQPAAALSPKAGSVSGWLPDTSFFPVTPKSIQAQTSTPCSNCFAFGYLWTVVQFTNPAVATDRMLRVVATDPSDQTVIRIDEFAATTAGFGGNNYPKLNLVGSTLILTYTLTVGAGPTNLIARSLTGIGLAWGGENVIAGSPGYLVYDASTYSSTLLSVAIGTGIASSVSLLTTAFAVSATQAIADVSGNPLTEISVCGLSSFGTGEIYVGYACAATPATKVRVFTANLAGTVGTATVDAASAIRPLICLNPATNGVVTVWRVITTFGVGSFFFSTVSSAAVAGGALQQQSFSPVSIPFSVGTKVYIWTKTETGGPGYATLLRLQPTLYAALEASAQDYLTSINIASGASQLDQRGLPVPVQIGTAGTYAVTVPSLYTTPSSITQGHDFRVLQMRHYSENANRRSVPALYADSSAFLPMGALTRVDDRGAVEEGFVHQPTIGTITPAAGAGALTPSSDYYYTAIYKSRNSNGRIEVSAPATPVKISMGVGQNQNTVNILSLGITARNVVSIEVYRTLSNGQTFYLDSVLDSATGFVNYLDVLSDAIVSQQKALYTQVGQTLANAFPPPARFGCVGGQRLFLGGLLRPDVVQASKLIFGDQSPSFADNDAFRIVLPGACTGLAWMDVLVMFTNEGIYIASSDGPDDSGVGDFGNLTRMPYELGCIEPRSVVVVDDGCFFQTARGLYLLPRGFGAPVAADNAIIDQLSGYPVITGAAVLTKAGEQSVHWTCTGPEALPNGNRVIYDLAHKAWSADTTGLGLGPCGAGQWAGGEVALFSPNLSLTPALFVTNSAFSDAGAAYTVLMQTGHLRPFGVLSEGSLIKTQLLATLKSACTLSIGKFTEFGGSTATRVFALAADDYQVGQNTVTDIELGPIEAREAVRVQFEFSETSTSEGLSFIALSLEHEQGEGLKRASPLSRVT